MKILYAFTASTLLLTGCGTGGGSGNYANSVAFGTGDTVLNFNNIIGVQGHTDGMTGISHSTAYRTINLDSVKINGKNYSLMPIGTLQKDNYREYIRPNDLRASVASPNARAGLVRLNDDATVFTHGVEAKTIPNFGVAWYDGTFFHLQNNKLSTGKVQLTANFSNKSINGDFWAGTELVFLDGTIDLDEGTFNGEKFGTVVTGTFYGNQSQDVAGIYGNKAKGYMGGFAASK